jgi:hypothetical protein
MMGSAVSLLAYDTAGQHFCLSVVSGITTLVLQVRLSVRRCHRVRCPV